MTAVTPPITESARRVELARQAFEAKRIADELCQSANLLRSLLEHTQGGMPPPLIWLGPELRYDRIPLDEWIEGGREVMRAEMERHLHLLRQLEEASNA